METCDPRKPPSTQLWDALIGQARQRLEGTAGERAAMDWGGTHTAAGVAALFVWYNPCRVKEVKVPRPGAVP